MNPEAIKHRQAIRTAKQRYHAREITQAELYAVVDAYRDWMAARQKEMKVKVRNFSRDYILRNI